MPEAVPRAFATGTGFVFQGAGVGILALGCVLWLFGANWAKWQAPAALDTHAYDASASDATAPAPHHPAPPDRVSQEPIPATDATTPLAQAFQPANISSTVLYTATLLSLVGGLALATAGVGLQAEKRSSALVGLIVAATLAIAYLAMAIALAFVVGAYFTALLASVVSAGAGVLFLLATHSASVLRTHPPPPDQSIVSDEWIEQYHQQRRQSRGH